MELICFLLLLVVWLGGFPCFSYVMNKSDFTQFVYLASWIALSIGVVLLGSMQF